MGVRGCLGWYDVAPPLRARLKEYLGSLSRLGRLLGCCEGVEREISSSNPGGGLCWYCMKQAHTFLRQTLDERQLAILVGLCVAACREVLQLSNANAPRTLSTPAGEPIPSHATTALGVEDAQKGKGIGAMASRDTDLSGQQTNPDVANNAATNTSEPKLLLTVEEAAARLNVGRPKMWQLVMRKEVLSLKIGASRRIPRAALEEYVQRLSAEAAQAAPSYRSYQPQPAQQSQHSPHDQHDQRDRPHRFQVHEAERMETYGKRNEE